MTLTQIVNAFGAFYLGSGKAAEANRTRLFNKLFQPSITASYFMVEPTNATKWRATRAFMTRVLQPFQKDWTPLNGVEFKPKEFDLYKMKVDMEEQPDDLEPTYVGFLTRLANETNQSIENLMRTSWPFVRWYIEEYLINQMQEDLEMNEIFWGEFVAPTPGTPGAIGTTMDGINKILNDGRTSGSTVIQTTGALQTATPADFVEQIEDFVEGVFNSDPFNKLRSQDFMLFMRSYNFDRYLRGFRDKYGKETDQSTLKRNTIDGKPNITIAALPSMDAHPTTGVGSNKIWMSASKNMIRPTIFGKNMEQIQTKLANNPRTVQFWTDSWMAVNFIIDEAVAVNEL